MKHYVDTKPRLRCLWIYSQLLHEAVMSVLVTTIYGRWRGTITDKRKHNVNWQLSPMVTFYDGFQILIRTR